MESRVRFVCLIIIVALVFPEHVLGKEAVFGIRVANLNGEEVRTIYTDPYRQATHIRVSPDGQWIMFSRYNDKDPKEGLAMENIGGKNHYLNTELVLMRSDGSQIRTIVPPKKGVMAVNSNWTDDGKGFVFVSTDNRKRVPEIRRAYLNSKMEIARFSTIRLPKHLVPVDPHLHKGRLVFPAVDLRNMVRGLWIAKEDGSGYGNLQLLEIQLQEI
jgi:dipeptidyl aminopeptidase/acylaminoacyl peptidase